jgi:hypothetical protein
VTTKLFSKTFWGLGFIEQGKRRRNIWSLAALVAFAVLLAPASKADTYVIDELLPGGGNITGTLTTSQNGSYIEISSWSFGVSRQLGGGGRSTRSSGPVETNLLGDLSVNSSGLVFNFGAGNGGYMMFPVTNNDGNITNGASYIEFVAGQCPICGEIEAVNIGGDGVTAAITGLTTSEVIGTAAPTPEPAPLALLAIGACMVIGLRWRRALAEN